MSKQKRRSPASTEEMARGVRLSEMHGPSEAARLLGRPRATVQAWSDKYRNGELDISNVTASEEWEKERVGLLDRIRDLEGQIRGAHRAELTEENIREAIFGLVGQQPKPPRWLVQKDKSKSGEGTPCAIWSDWHFGEIVDPAQVNDINQYDIATAQQRVRRLVEKTIQLCDRLQDDYPGFVLNLGGDMISGDIHEELSETNELPTMPVLLELFGVLIWAIEKLADRFGRVFVPCVAGNHGRNTHKPRFKDHNYSNFDWLLYCLLEKHFANDDRVQFLIPAGLDAYYSVQGHRFLLTHGHALGTAGGDGIIGALGPILRGDFKSRRAAGDIGLPYDTLVIGHWHQYVPLLKLIVNGTIKGFDEYAKNKLRASPETPCQALWFVHPDVGITSIRPVYVDDRIEDRAADKTFVTWPE